MRIGLFITCLVDGLFPDVGKATVALLERLGRSVEVPMEQTCCGQMHLNTGYTREARPMVRGFAEVFSGYDVVVTPSGSCAGSVRHQHAGVAERMRDDALVARAGQVAVGTAGDAPALGAAVVRLAPGPRSSDPAGGDVPLPDQDGSTMSSRAEVLGRIRTALRDRPAAPDVPRAYRAADQPDEHTLTELIDLLADRVSDYRAAVRRCAPPDLPATIAAALRDRGVRRIVVPTGLDPAWLGAVVGLSLVPDDPPLTAADLDAVDEVVTSCAVAVAETGTIVLDAGPGQGRRIVSLLPDYHLVVVPPDAVVGSVPAAVGRLVPTRPLTWISGPSATSDIELDRVEGVHGSRNLEVILVDAPQQ